jgi:hypothetical protein
MKPTNKQRATKNQPAGENWRFHKNLYERFADSKSEYISDLIRRDAVKKGASHSKSGE